MSNNIELYFYFNLTKPGKYSYEGLNFSFLYEPVYVGIGLKNRHKAHFINARYLLDKTYKYKSKEFEKRDRNYPKLIFIKKMIEEHKLTLNDMCFVLMNYLTKEHAKELEIFYIAKIGRQIDSQGPLLNYTLGGDGGKGVKWTEEQKKEKSDSMKGSKNPMFGKKGELCPSFGLVRSEETKEKHSTSKMGDKNPQYGKPSWNKGLHWDNRMKEIISLANIDYVYKFVNPEGEIIIIDRNLIKFLMKMDLILAGLHQHLPNLKMTIL